MGSFKPPLEAPIFEPNDEEFQDPLAYIAKIKSLAEKHGICKIRPPPNWQPPFAVDVDNFKFTPRIQRLNELEAHTRIKLNFLDRLAKFWDLQGSSLKIPKIEKRSLDFYNLHKYVQQDGGFDLCCRERKWARIATKMGYPAGRNIGTMLRLHYERILYPYDVFDSDVNLKHKLDIDTKPEDNKADLDYVPHGIVSRQAIKPPLDRYSRRSKRRYPVPISHEQQQLQFDQDGNEIENSELRKLQFYGAGPKMPGYSPKSPVKSDDKSEVKTENIDIVANNPAPDPYEYRDDDFSPHPQFKSQVEKYYCKVCGRGDVEEQLLLCDGCDDSYHTFCLNPPLSEVPKGDWRCPKCVAVEVDKPKEAFGFEQAQKEYSLQSFGEMADNFKSDYFNMPVHMVPCSMVEQEFWRIVSAIDEDVTVEYGADLHTMDHGSGFPVKDSTKLVEDDEIYANSQWNLNNLPDLKNSILSHINADINGMKIPWAYVGMCFAAFCWHNEDHWSYSINYLHWGEPKTWYGVAGDNAKLFEDAMRAAAPELFANQPDLLHQLVTIMNPNLLLKSGIPICRTDQHAGEFVVTFPRAYHAGFNQGYNFAEAVNFCLTDWLPYGRLCINHYSQLHRYCVFSHDELICKMAADPDSLDLDLAAATYQDMLQMVETERGLRRSLMDRGVTNAEREAFELLPDDERQCDYCKTTCFLSAITCNVCSDNDCLVCLQHVDKLCSCSASNLCLRYRYSLDELPLMLQKLKVRAESFDKWAQQVKNALEASEDNKQDLDDLKELVEEAEEMKFEDCDLLKTLESAIQEAEKCSNVAQQLVSKKVRTRNRQSGEANKYAARLTLEELLLFHEQICNLACDIKETGPIKELVSNVKEFQSDAKKMLETEEMPESSELEKLLEVGVTLDIDLPEIPSLKKKSQQAQWLEEVSNTLEDPHEVTLDALRGLLDSGVNLPPHPSVEKAMAELQDLLTIGERTEEKAKICLQAKPRQSLSMLDEIINDASKISVYLPNVLSLEEYVKKGKEWCGKVEMMQAAEHYPYLEVLENLVNKGRPIPVRLDQLPQLESQVTAAKGWKERTARTYLKKNSPFSLLEVLSPRMDIGIYQGNKGKKRKIVGRDGVGKDDKDGSLSSLDYKFEEVRDPAAIVKAFKESEENEIRIIREFRMKNLQKRAEDGSVTDARYCICSKGLSGYMLQCELCKDWFHASCVPLPKLSNASKLTSVGNKETSSNAASTSRDLKFLCPGCLRSRRPRLETILSLLVALQKLPVRLPEGEALQCLTERAMSWQDRARQALATDELAAALAKLSVLSQQIVEQAAREKTERIISTELLKAACKPERQNRKDDDIVPPTFDSYDETASADSTTDSMLDRNSDSDSVCEDVTPKHSSFEHAYSTASKPTSSMSDSASNSSADRKKHARKSTIVPRSLEPPVLEMSEIAKAQLEELMMEGDLLEVSLDETQHIWRILQATKQRRSDEPSYADILAMEVDVKKEDRKSTKRKFGDASDKHKKSKILKNGDDKMKKKKLKSADKTPEGRNNKIDNKNKKQKKKVKMDRISEDDESDTEEICSADTCQRPSGEEVNWVQCDGGCDLWFHLLCVGLNKNDVSETEDYICVACGNKDDLNADDVNCDSEDDDDEDNDSLADDINT